MRVRTTRRMRRSILALALAAALPASAQLGTRADAPPRTIRRSRNHVLLPASNLAGDAAQSRARRVPILMMFDRDDCPYCERALREHLVPMSLEPPWRDDALFRQVEVDKAIPAVDFDGSATTHRALAARYGATLTPTVVVVDATGAPLAEPVVGLLTADFYGAYLEAALKKGLARLRS
jgi:hypothetical protein